MQQVGFVCEYDESHALFTSRFNRSPYLEAHHLIPLGMENSFSFKLDIIDNPTCLCPFCHKAVHHASEDFARAILIRLSEKTKIAEKFNLTKNEIFSLYAVEEID